MRGSFPNSSPSAASRRIASEVAARARSGARSRFLSRVDAVGRVRLRRFRTRAISMSALPRTSPSITIAREFDNADVARIERREAAVAARSDAGLLLVAVGTRRSACTRYRPRSAQRSSSREWAGTFRFPQRIAMPAATTFSSWRWISRARAGGLCRCVPARATTNVPDARLRIVGAKPPDDVLAIPGVSYEGDLNKSVTRSSKRLQEQLLASSFALVHPTVKDATPQVIVEAAVSRLPSHRAAELRHSRDGGRRRDRMSGRSAAERHPWSPSACSGMMRESGRVSSHA